MDFFNSLSEVAKNRQNFKKWEEQQKHTQAQREELAKRRQHSEAELKQAKEFGETIIDVVDIMDNHSENVAENVETAVDPLSSLVTLATFFGGNFLVGKHSTTPLMNKIDEIKKKNINSEEAKDLVKRIQDYKVKTNAHNSFSKYDLDSKREIERIKDNSLKKEARNFYTKLNKEIKPIKNKIIRNHAGVFLATVGAFIASTIFEAKLQTDSSKIARYQARRELDDAKSFVNYTPEQIAAAKKEMAEHPELLKKEKKSKLKSGMFRSIYGIIKDRRAYKRDKSARTDDSQKVTRQLTPEEIIQAEKDKEVIQRTVRLINNEAEKYSENMEVAANVIMGATPVLGATIGAGTGWILNKTGVLDKFINKTVENYGSEETKNLYKELKTSKKTGLAYLKQWAQFTGSLFEGKRLESDFDSEAIKKGGKAAAKNKKQFKEIVNKFFTAGFTHKWGKAGILGLIGGIVSGFAGMMIGLKLQKSSARAGRFTAKRELEKNPENFIGYTQEDYEEVKDVKSNKKNTNKFKEYALFIPNVMKQYWAYNKYKKTEYKEKQVLNDLLKKQDVTDEQLRDAKNLQRKIFNTFEKVDDNSQVYSESMEAATEIAQPFVWYGGMALAASPLIVTGVQVARGKITPAKLLQKITNKLSSASNIMKKKWFKKYLNNVSKNISTQVNNVSLKEDIYYIKGKNTYELRPLGAVIKGVDFQKDPIIDIIRKIFKNSQLTADEIRTLSNSEQIERLYLLKNRVLKFTENSVVFSKEENKAVNDFFEVLINGHKTGKDWENAIYITPEIRADIIDLFVNPKNLTPEKAEVATQVLEKAIGPKFAESVYSLSPVLHNAADFVTSNDFKIIVNSLEKFIDNVSGEYQQFPLSKKHIQLLEKFLGKENFQKLLSENSKLNIQEFLKPKAGITKQEEIANLVAIDANDAKKLLNAIIDKSKKATIGNALDLIPTKYTNPKQAISSLKSKIEKMSPEEFEDFAFNTIHIKSMDKKTMLDILPKVEKILANLPKEELNKILTTMVKEFQEHPDEFLKLVQSGGISSIFITPGLKKALITAGISWTAFSIAITYIVEAWMADMQLKAGRLGVMKAMEALDDPAYYANIEPTETANTKPQEQQTVQPSLNTTNLLAKFKQVS